MHMASQCSIFIFAFLLTTIGIMAGERRALVNVVVDMTPEGRKAAHPTPDHPAYYFPVIGGYRQEGQAIAGDKRPTQFALLHLAAVELAKQGYLVVHPGKTSPPDIILVFSWGTLNPDTIDLQGGGLVPLNINEMLAMVAGNTLENVSPDVGASGDTPIGFMSPERHAIGEAVLDNRYCIVITAYDFPATIRQKKEVPLWQAKMSVSSAGVAFDDVMPALIAAGGPLFGRETTFPQRITFPVTPDGRVIVGTPVLVHYHDAPLPPPAPSSSPVAK
jgi:hypothetical protein